MNTRKGSEHHGKAVGVNTRKGSEYTRKGSERNLSPNFVPPPPPPRTVLLCHCTQPAAVAVPALGRVQQGARQLWQQLVRIARRVQQPVPATWPSRAREHDCCQRQCCTTSSKATHSSSSVISLGTAGNKPVSVPRRGSTMGSTGSAAAARVSGDGGAATETEQPMPLAVSCVPAFYLHLHHGGRCTAASRPPTRRRSALSARASRGTFVGAFRKLPVRDGRQIKGKALR